MSKAQISRSFNDTIIKAILILSLDTTLRYMILAGASVFIPSATKKALLVNFP